MASPNRLHHGRGHEIAVRERLKAHGYAVQDWGQGLIDDTIRAEIRHGSREPVVLWRWIPDLIAVKSQRIILVDPKTDLRSDTDNFSIEVSAWQAHLTMLPLGLPIVYVWSDFTCNAAHKIRPVKLLPGVAEGRTSFYLVRKDEQHPFEWAFGPLLKAVLVMRPAYAARICRPLMHERRIRTDVLTQTPLQAATHPAAT